MMAAPYSTAAKSRSNFPGIDATILPEAMVQANMVMQFLWDSGQLYHLAQEGPTRPDNLACVR